MTWEGEMRGLLILSLSIGAISYGAFSFEIGWESALLVKPASFAERFGSWHYKWIPSPEYRAQPRRSSFA
jgi:hypothetical protein